MLSRIIFILVFYPLSIGVFAQKNDTDSLESLVMSIPSDTTKVWLLNKLVFSLRERDNNKALEYAQEAVRLAELLTYKRGEGQALEHLGWILYRQGDYSNSFNASRQALKIAELLQDQGAVARCLINIAAIEFEQKRYTQALDNFKKAYRASELLNDHHTMARSLNNISFTFIQLNHFDSAVVYAKYALDKSANLTEKYMTGFSMRTLGDIYLAKKDYKKALEYFLPTLETALRENNIFLTVSTYHRLGKTYMMINQPDRALQYLIQNIELARQYGYQDELERSYKLIAEIYFNKNDLAKAYHYQSAYIAIHDSLYNQRNVEQMALMQSQFDAEMREAQIGLLTKETALNEEEINSQRVWLYFYIGCLSLMVILAFVLVYHNRNTNRAKVALEGKNQEIQFQAHQLRNLNATKDKLFSIISHDLRSPVASLRALLELMDTTGLTQQEFTDLTRALKRNLDSVYQDLDNLLLWAQTQLKGLQATPESVSLSEIVDEKIGLFKEAAKNKRLVINNFIQPHVMVFADRNHVSLVLRNLLTNAIKFNQPGGKITLSSREKGDYYEVSVSDSGVGIAQDDLNKLFNAGTHFSKPGTNKEKGLGIGLLLTKEFIETNQGSIWVTSELGRGTTFTFALPARPVEELV